MLNLVSQRMFENAEHLQQLKEERFESESEQLICLSKALLEVANSINTLCEGSSQDRNAFLKNLTTYFDTCFTSEQLRSSFSHYLSHDLLPLLQESSCKAFMHSSNATVVHEIHRRPAVNNSTLFDEGGSDLRVVEFDVDSSSKLRGLLVSPPNADISSYIEAFGSLEFGGFFTINALRKTIISDEWQTDQNILLAYYHRALVLALAFSPLLGHNTEGSIPVLSMLCLGVGGGEIVNFLSSHFPNLYIEAVDVDANVLQIANEYFALPLSCETMNSSCRLHITINDAWAALDNYVASNITFNFLVVDLFDEGVIDAALNSSLDSNIASLHNEASFRALGEGLDKDSGIFILHLHMNFMFDSYMELIRSEFQDVFTLMAGGSVIVVAAYFNFKKEGTRVDVDGEMETFDSFYLGSHPCDNLTATAHRLEDFGRRHNFPRQIFLGSRFDILC